VEPRTFRAEKSVWVSSVLGGPREGLVGGESGCLEGGERGWGVLERVLLGGGGEEVGVWWRVSGG